MTIAKIRSLCEEQGISLAELERKTDLGNGVVARWDGASPKVDNVKKVADFFGVTIDYLIREGA